MARRVPADRGRCRARGAWRGSAVNGHDRGAGTRRGHPRAGPWSRRVAGRSSSRRASRESTGAGRGRRGRGRRENRPRTTVSACTRECSRGRARGALAIGRGPGPWSCSRAASACSRSRVTRVKLQRRDSRSPRLARARGSRLLGASNRSRCALHRGSYTAVIRVTGRDTIVLPAVSACSRCKLHACNYTAGFRVTAASQSVLAGVSACSRNGVSTRKLHACDSRSRQLARRKLSRAIERVFDRTAKIPKDRGLVP